VLLGLPQGVGGLLNIFSLMLIYFYNTHQVLVELSQDDGGLAILFDII
jgi:hypothetical protein